MKRLRAWRLSRPWQEATVWMTYTLSGLLAPALLSGLAVLAFHHSLTLGFFTDGGQFAIYSVALWVTVLYLIVRQTPKRLPFERGLGLFNLFGYLISLLMFLLAALSSIGLSIDSRFVEWPSVGLFVLSSALTFWAVAEDSKRMGFDPRAARETQFQSLRSEFEQGG
ncbi:MAG: hypothetical protein KGJ86_07175 [Chloroflexota bacterium]|nr:hypothetical protein [Chloroflexota bacterium]